MSQLKARGTQHKEFVVLLILSPAGDTRITKMVDVWILVLLLSPLFLHPHLIPILYIYVVMPAKIAGRYLL